ncbi:hypothetical protein D3C72_296750 [compost metagenome]
MVDPVAIAAQRVDQFAQKTESVLEGRKLGDLAADMHIDAGNFDAGKRCRMGIDVAGAFIGDAELVFLLAGRDLGMCSRIHIRVDAEGDMRLFPGLDCAKVEDFQFRFGFDVETVDAGFQREVHFADRLADAGKHDAVGRNAGRQRAAQFAARNDIDTGAKAAECLQHGLVGIGLHGVADHGVDIGKRCGEDLVMALQRCRRIDVERGSNSLGDVANVDVFGVQHAVDILEMVHVRSRKLQKLVEDEGALGDRVFFCGVRFANILLFHGRAWAVQLAFAAAANGNDAGKAEHQGDAGGIHQRLGHSLLSPARTGGTFITKFQPFVQFISVSIGDQLIWVQLRPRQ